jgi:hypothetical protein
MEGLEIVHHPCYTFPESLLSVLLSHLEPSDEFHLLQRRETSMVVPVVRGIIANGSISG